jgi:hypothetical protein
VPIQTITVSNTSTSFLSFYNIPQTYQDLMLVLNGRSARAVSSMNSHITWASGQFFSGTVLQGNGSSSTSSRFSNTFDPTNGVIPGASSTSGIFGTSVTDILNYRNSQNFKTAISRWACDINGSGTVGIYTNLVRVTSPITNIDVYKDFADTWAVGTTATLYGIKAVS